MLTTSATIKRLEKYRKSGLSNRTQEARIKLLYDVTDEKYHKSINKILEKYPTFLTDPASTKYHGAYEGGLFDHSVAVYEAALRCEKIYDVQEVNPIACIFHDLCKTGSYVKNVVELNKEGTSKIIKFDYNPDAPMTIGHGAESLRRLSKCGIVCDDNWSLAVYYHMGVFESYTSKNDEMNFSKYTEKVPEILLLHHADMIACKIYHI